METIRANSINYGADITLICLYYHNFPRYLSTHNTSRALFLDDTCRNLKMLSDLGMIGPCVGTKKNYGEL